MLYAYNPRLKILTMSKLEPWKGEERPEEMELRLGLRGTQAGRNSAWSQTA